MNSGREMACNRSAVWLFSTLRWWQCGEPGLRDGVPVARIDGDKWDIVGQGRKMQKV